MSSLTDAINSLKIENRFESVMGKIALNIARECITVPEASHKTAEKTKDITGRTATEPSLRK